MSDRPSSYIAQEWSVHAQLTFSHHRPDVEVTPPTPQQPDNGVHMEYSWNTVPISSPTGVNPRPCYGFQRGNITFTTRPATVSVNPSQRADEGFRDSGYVSERIASGYYGSLPSRRPTQPYNRRCKSTCSITLSNDHMKDDISKTTVTRSNSLDAPTLPTSQESSPCDHARGQNAPLRKGVSPVLEVCEVCGGERSPSSLRRASNYTTHFCTRVPDKTPVTDVVKPCQDAASQTQDDESKRKKPLVSKPAQPRMGNKLVYNTRRKTDTELLQIPPSDTTDTGNDTPTGKRGKRLSRSPARLSGKSPMLSSRKSSSHSPESKSQGHKPRTVHIDVYCTGSDASDSSSSSSTDSDAGTSLSSPQTVFESEKLRIVHTRVGKDRLPPALVHRKSDSCKPATPQETSTRGYDSDDGLSSLYPSQFSSFSSVGESSTSRDPSSSTISSSSCALSDGYDSAAATSWKDTVTDLDSASLLHSNPSLAQSDSFEYADSIDRLRIRERERAWATGEESKTWRSPQAERKHMIQQQRLKEFLEKRLTQGVAFPLWKAGKSDESDDDGDETGDAWSFGGESSSRVSTLKREDTVRKATPANLTTQPPPPDADKDKQSMLFSPPNDVDSFSDTSPRRLRRRVIAPFGSRSPSPILTKLESSVTSPFTARVGLRTDQLSRAEKFGTIVGAFRKPGHHIGPSKNPECSCTHCRNYYFEQNECRGRTRSLDMSLEAADNWKVQLQKQISEKRKGSLVGSDLAEVASHEDDWDDSAAV